MQKWLYLRVNIYFSGINPALAAQLHASTAAQMGSHPPVSGLDLSNLTAMHAMLQKQNEL